MEIEVKNASVAELATASTGCPADVSCGDDCTCGGDCSNDTE